MGENIINQGAAILLGVIGIATLAVLVSKNAQTGSVLTSGGQAFAGILQAAESPVSGGSGLTNFGGASPITIQ